MRPRYIAIHAPDDSGCVCLDDIREVSVNGKTVTLWWRELPTDDYSEYEFDSEKPAQSCFAEICAALLSP